MRPIHAAPGTACCGSDLRGPEVFAVMFSNKPHPARDAVLLDALVELRLSHDEGALVELRKAADATVSAHLAGMAATGAGRLEHEVCAAMEATLARRGFGTAYGSIVTVHGVGYRSG